MPLPPLFTTPLHHTTSFHFVFVPYMMSCCPVMYYARANLKRLVLETAKAKATLSLQGSSLSRRPGFPAFVGLAPVAAHMVAERVRSGAHLMQTRCVLIAAAMAPTAHPQTVQLGKPAVARQAGCALAAATRGARLAVVEARRLVGADIRAGNQLARARILSGRAAVGIYHLKVGAALAGREMVVMVKVVGAHLYRNTINTTLPGVRFRASGVRGWSIPETPEARKET